MGIAILIISVHYFNENGMPILYTVSFPNLSYRLDFYFNDDEDESKVEKSKVFWESETENTQKLTSCDNCVNKFFKTNKKKK